MAFCYSSPKRFGQTAHFPLEVIGQALSACVLLPALHSAISAAAAGGGTGRAQRGCSSSPSDRCPPLPAGPGLENHYLMYFAYYLVVLCKRINSVSVT